MKITKVSALFLTVVLMFSFFAANGAVFADTSVTFTALDGTAGNTGEGYTNLLDNKTTTKWCVNHADDEDASKFGGAYVVIAASQKNRGKRLYFYHSKR